MGLRSLLLCAALLGAGAPQSLVAQSLPAAFEAAAKSDWPTGLGSAKISFFISPSRAASARESKVTFDAGTRENEAGTRERAGTTAPRPTIAKLSLTSREEHGATINRG